MAQRLAEPSAPFEAVVTAQGLAPEQLAELATRAETAESAAVAAAARAGSYQRTAERAEAELAKERAMRDAHDLEVEAGLRAILGAEAAERARAEYTEKLSAASARAVAAERLADAEADEHKRTQQKLAMLVCHVGTAGQTVCESDRLWPQTA